MLVVLIAGALAGIGLTWLSVLKLRERGISLHWWQIVERTVSVVVLFLMIITVGYQILVRFGLHELGIRAPWTDELARLLLVWTVFWAATSLQRTDDQISMSIFAEKLPPRGRLIVALMGDVVTLIVLGTIAYYGFLASLSAFPISSLTLGTTSSVFNFVVPIGLGLMVIHTLFHVGRRVRGKKIQKDFDADEFVGEA